MAIRLAFADSDRLRLSPLQDLAHEKLLIDSRRPLAGNGDTASTMLLVQNLLRRGYQGTVDVLVDEKSERILRTLSRNLPGFEQAVRILHESELPNEIYSVVIRSGLPSGRIFMPGLKRTSNFSGRNAGQINVDEQTIFFSLTIYGNSKNAASLQPLSLTAQGDQYFLLPAAGLGVNRSDAGGASLDEETSGLDFEEGGIFRDPFSISIRNWTLGAIEKFLIEQSGPINPNLQSLLQTVIGLRQTENLKYSLAYGDSNLDLISAPYH